VPRSVHVSTPQPPYLHGIVPNCLRNKERFAWSLSIPYGVPFPSAKTQVTKPFLSRRFWKVCGANGAPLGQRRAAYRGINIWVSAAAGFTIYNSQCWHFHEESCMTPRNSQIIRNAFLSSSLPPPCPQSSRSQGVGALMRCVAWLGVFPCGTKRLVSNLRGVASRSACLPPSPTPPNTGDLPCLHSISKSGYEV
jgi:hypothetical protein